MELPTCRRCPSGAFLLCILPSCHSQERCRASPAPSPAWPRNLLINRTRGGGGAAPREAIVSHGQKSHLPRPLLNSQRASKINHHHFLGTQSDTGLSTVRAQKHEREQKTVVYQQIINSWKAPQVIQSVSPEDKKVHNKLSTSGLVAPSHTQNPEPPKSPCWQNLSCNP